jgi:hypothetical protein
MSRADIACNCVFVGTSLLCLFITWACALAVWTSEANIAFADADCHLACSLDEAFTIATTDLALEHWAGDVASLSSIWLFALAAGASRHSLWVFDACSAQLTTTCKIRLWVHWAAVGAGLSHVCLLALAGGFTLLSIYLTVTVAVARLTSLTQSWAGDGAVCTPKA